MINKILNWIKNIFKPEKQDPHLTLYEEPVNRKSEKKDPHLVLYEEVEKPKLTHCEGHLRFRKSCPRCQEIVA